MASERDRDATEAVTETAEDVAAEEQPRGIHRLLARIRGNRAGHLTLKVAVAIVGFAIMAVGFALIPLPGPGWALVLLGLAVLSIEYAWAHHLFGFTKRQLGRWLKWVNRQSILVRMLIGLAGLVFVGAVVWLSVRVSFHVDLVTTVLEFLRK